MTTTAPASILFSMLVVAGAGCAVRTGATPTEMTPVAVPRSTPPAAPSQPATNERAVAGTESETSPAPPATTGTAGTTTPPAEATDAPAPTSAAYVFTPEQTVAARPSSARPGSAPPGPPVSEGRDAAPREPRDERPGAPPGELRLVVVAPVRVIAAGTIISVDVMASSSSAVVDAPLHLTFDPNVLEFVDGAPGDFLTQGGSSIVFLADGSSRPGDVAVAAGRVEREHGASGAGLLCRVRFRGVGAGTTPVLVGDAKVWGTRGEALTVLADGTNVVVR